ncbi:unnamed protein product, partial [Polarella glacialis]
AGALENKRLRRELEGLRALAHWQQGEFGAALACSATAASQPCSRNSSRMPEANDLLRTEPVTAGTAASSRLTVQQPSIARRATASSQGHQQ